MDETRLRGTLQLDLADGGHIGTLQPDGARWRARHFPAQTGLPWEARGTPVETVHPDFEAARAWLLAQPRPPSLDSLVPGAERLAGLVVRRVAAAEGLQAVQVLGGYPNSEAFVTSLPPVGKRGIPHPGRRPGLLLADGPPTMDGTRRFQILLVWADHGETGEPVAWPPESRRRGARPLRDALVEAGAVHLESAHARLAWRTAIDGPWPAWPDPNPFDEKRR